MVIDSWEPLKFIEEAGIKTIPKELIIMAKGFMDCYKTYDTNQGYGKPSQWKQAFKERMNLDEAEAFMREQKTEVNCLADLKACKTLLELKKVYHQLMNKFHPDHGGDTATAQQIVATYAILKERL